MGETRDLKSARNYARSAQSHAGRCVPGTPFGASRWHTRGIARRSICPTRNLLMRRETATRFRTRSRDMKRIFLAIAAGIAATPRFAACADAQPKELRLVPKDAFVRSIAPSPRAPFSLKAERAPGAEL